jgi:outer membrane protein
MKRLIVSLGMILGYVSTLLAQDLSKKWTLDDCINYAIEHNIITQQLNLKQQEASVNLNSARMSRLPNLNVNTYQNWNFGRNSNNQQGVYEDLATSSTGISVSSSIPVFAGFQINNQIKASKLDMEAATQQLEKAREDLAINITSLFLQVLFKKEIVRVSEEQLALSKQQIEQTKILVDVGKVPKSQLFDMEAQVARDEVTAIESRTNLTLALLDLAQNLELEDLDSFDVQAPENKDISKDEMDVLLSPNSIYNQAVQLKPIIKEQEYLLESSKKNLQVARSGYYPQLSLGMSYSNSYFYIHNTDNNISFSNQLSNNGGETIGLTLSIPIFNRNQARNRVRIAKLNMKNQQLELDNAKKTLYKQIQTAHINAIVARERYHAAARAVVASKESFKYAQERYNVGKLSAFEFNDAKTKLTQSESTQIQAKYDYIFRTKILDFYHGIPITL